MAGRYSGPPLYAGDLSEIDPNLKETECVSVRETMNKKKYDMVIRPCDERISSICRKTDGKTDGSMMTY